MNLLSTLRLVFRTYRSHPRGARLHVLIRFFTCPFLRIIGALPRDARSLLEIGAGHGLFARLAVAHGIQRAVGVEPDARKLHPVEGVSMVTGYDVAVRGTFDVVAIIDALYAVPFPHWDEFLTRARERLAPGGMLMIKEQDPTSVKDRWNHAQEWLSAKLLNITLADAFDYEPPEAFVGRLTRLGFRDVASKRIDFGYPHPHVLYVARK
jgi:2-polyprenyl-3-methyl-5-hydroxy-6-metoxy-1,4-benzoquinol methylase